MFPLLIFTITALLASIILNRRKTLMGLKKGSLMFLNLFFPFLTILIFVSLLLTFISKETIVEWLGSSSGPFGLIFAALVGSISLIPGFIAFPLGSMLIKMGVSYQVIAVFITTLMMVGIITLPLEAKYFGWKTALIRNALSFISAIIIGIAIGALWSHV
jgi:uncharacterized membrane protein YraQ (UPF0718 family)